jgi:hypothetical protein
LAKILALMDEYLAKLRHAQAGIDHVDFRRSSGGLAAFFMLASLGAGLWWTIDMGRGFLALSISLGVLSTVGVAASLMLAMQTFQQERRFKRELRVTEKLLERLIRLSSQAAEHQKLDMTQRLELELRLAETESAIEQANSTHPSPLTSLVRDTILQVSKV